MQAAVDARNEGLEIVIQARIDSYNTDGWEEAIYRANEFLRVGVDVVFIETLPDHESMARAVRETNGPICANIIEGEPTENMSARDLGEIGMCTVAYPWTLVAAHLKSTREALESLKKSFTLGKPGQILSYVQVCYGVGFNKYWDLEERYKFNADGLIWKGNATEKADLPADKSV
jgi:methylisocitrate lyase